MPMPTRETITVGDMERIRPDAEYIRCYRALAKQGHCRYDPNTRYSDLPGMLLKHAERLALLEGLHTAFADIERGCTLWDL